jgi:hypothetical protein
MDIYHQLGSSQEPQLLMSDVNLNPLGYRYLAVCDVLGFSAFISGSPLKDVVSKYSVLLNQMQTIKQKFSNLFPFMFPFSSSEFDLVKAVVFSDSIIVYTVPISPKARLHDIGVVSCFFDVCASLCVSSLYLDLPLRVGIAYGETFFHEKQEMFLGIPIVAAHELELKQDWIGGACDSSCETAPHFHRVTTDWQDVLRYDVPSQNGREPMWALNWPKLAVAQEVLKYLERKIGEIQNEKVVKKYREAMQFLEWSNNLRRGSQGK